MILLNGMNSFNGGVQPVNGATKLLNSPKEITLSENINNFEFEPALTGSGAKALTLIQPLTYVPVGTTITLVSNLGSITLTASATPNANEFWTNATVIPATPTYLEKVAMSIADAINQNISFNNNYVITLNSPNVIVFAKQYGSLYSITASVSDPLIIYKFTSAGSAFFNSENFIDYSCWAELYIGNTEYSDTINKYEMEFVDSYIVDSNTSNANLVPSVVSDYVEPILPLYYNVPTNLGYQLDKGEFTDGSLLPQLDYFGNQKKLLRPYFLLYGDSYRYVTNGQKKKYVEGCSAIRWVQLGAFDKLLPYLMIDYTWITNNTKSFLWMTSAPQYKSVTYTSHEYLQVICKKSATGKPFWIQTTYHFYDGTSIVDNKIAQPSIGLSGNISFDVSPVALGISTIESTNGKLVDSYDVKLKWDLYNATSQTRYYVMDRECYEHKKQIIFVNEFGAWDSLEFLGEITESLDRSVENINRSLPSNANSTSNNFSAVSIEVSLNINTNVNSNFALHSGLLNDEYIAWSRKLVESASVYIWDTTYNKYRNILISDFSIVYDTKLRGDSLSITFNYTTTNNTLKR